MPDVKVKGYSGAEFGFENVPKVWLAAPESTDDNPILVPFTYGEAVDGVEVVPDFSEGDQVITMPDGYLAKSAVVKQPEALTPENIRKGASVSGVEGSYEGDLPDMRSIAVELDFSEGDMEITPPEGTVFEKVSIPKPANLIPENIVEGVDIAGIFGSFTGGGSDILVKLGYFANNGSETKTISHGLGVIPAIVIAWAGDFYGSEQYIDFVFGVSEAGRVLLGLAETSALQMQVYFQGTAVASKYMAKVITGSDGAINLANQDTFTLSNNFGGTYGFHKNSPYRWLAIGLT